MTSEIEIRQQEVFGAYLQNAQKSFMAFIGGLIVPSGLGPMMLSLCMAEHQRDCFRELAPSLEALRDGVMPPKRRWWIERTKKASKDTDLAACLMWLLAFPTRPLFLQIGAADRDQAGIIKRRIDDYMYYNPWLAELIEVTAHKLMSKNKIATLDIVAADVAGSHGATPDLLVCNELSHVTKWEFIQNMLDNADGVPQGMVIIATNAGFKGTEAEKLRNVALESDKWTTHIFARPAPWISESDLKDAEARNPPSRFRRLWYGQWASGKGDAFDDSLIDRCLDERRAPVLTPEKGWFYLAGLDLGISHDHSGLVVVGANPNYPRLRLAYMKAFEPKAKGEVNLMEVEEQCLQIARHYRVTWFGFDPYQAKLMAQRLRAHGVPMREVPFVGTNLNQMASTLMEVLREGKLEAFDDEDGRLRRDFGKFSIVEKSYGYKLESVRDASGHADVGTALALCLPHAVQILDGRLLLPEDNLGYYDDEELTADEIAEMPQELREIYEWNPDKDKGFLDD